MQQVEAHFIKYSSYIFQVVWSSDLYDSQQVTCSIQFYLFTHWETWKHNVVTCGKTCAPCVKTETDDFRSSGPTVDADPVHVVGGKENEADEGNGFWRDRHQWRGIDVIVGVSKAAAAAANSWANTGSGSNSSHSCLSWEQQDYDSLTGSTYSCCWTFYHQLTASHCIRWEER